MNITITITNPTDNVLAALAGAHAADNAKMMESLDKASTALGVLLDEIARTKAQPEQAPNDAPVQDAPIITPQADPQDTGLTPAQVSAAQYDPQDTALRIASVADIDNYLDVGTEVHWHGAKFVFDGVVEHIDGEEEWYDDTKGLFIRRNDTDAPTNPRKRSSVPPSGAQPKSPGGFTPEPAPGT